MEQLITVKGTGSVKVSPDSIIISMELKTIDKDYEKSMSDAADALDRLREVLIAEGFSKGDLKTTNFEITASYENVRQRDGEFKQVFRGYETRHGLSLQFDFDSKRLGRVLSAMSRSNTVPEFNILFTVKDKDALSENVLQKAVINSRHKAEILAKAADLRLGEIISIDYNWGEVTYHSPTRVGMLRQNMMMAKMDASMDIQPGEINASDTVTIIWRIERSSGELGDK